MGQLRTWQIPDCSMQFQPSLSPAKLTSQPRTWGSCHRKGQLEAPSNCPPCIDGSQNSATLGMSPWTLQVCGCSHICFLCRDRIPISSGKYDPCEDNLLDQADPLLQCKGPQALYLTCLSILSSQTLILLCSFLQDSSTPLICMVDCLQGPRLRYHSPKLHVCSPCREEQTHWVVWQNLHACWGERNLNMWGRDFGAFGRHCHLDHIRICPSVLTKKRVDIWWAS